MICPGPVSPLRLRITGVSRACRTLSRSETRKIMIYGVPAPAREFERVEFPAESERAGLLGQVLFLALAAKPNRLLVARGLKRPQHAELHQPPRVAAHVPIIRGSKA